MRIIHWVLLLITFAISIKFAFVVARYTFDAKPVEVVDRGPTVKILVAKKEIPPGKEITADYVSFVDVPVSEIPEAAIANFMHAYRRRPAFPISEGCPICEDLLVSKGEDDSASIKYLPAGSQIVSLEVKQVRVGQTVSELTIPIDEVLNSGERVDIRMIAKQENQGELAEKKKQLLQAFIQPSSEEEEGEILLSDVPVHQVMSKAAEGAIAGERIQSFSLILNREEAQKLADAARSGRIRVVPRRLMQSQVETMESAEAETAESNVATEVVEAPAVSVQAVRDEPVIATSPKLQFKSIEPNDEINTIPTKDAIENRFSPAQSSLTFVPPRVIENPRSPARNESMAAPVAERRSTELSRPFPASPVRSERQTAQAVKTRIVEFGLVKPLTSDSAADSSYSPWKRDVAVEPEEDEDSEIPTPPLPLGSRTIRPR